jgi:hypothetical protein
MSLLGRDVQARQNAGLKIRPRRRADRRWVATAPSGVLQEQTRRAPWLAGDGRDGHLHAPRGM